MLDVYCRARPPACNRRRMSDRHLHTAQQAEKEVQGSMHTIPKDFDGICMRLAYLNLVKFKPK